MTKLVYFSAEWCGPCKKMGPIVEEFKEENPDVLVVKIDVDEDPDSASNLGVISIPTLVVMKDNKEINRKRGAISKPNLYKLVNGEEIE